MSKDPVQQVINRMSLVMTIPEDLVKACKVACLPSVFIEQVLRLHDQQRQIEAAVNEMRSEMLEMAKLINMQADFAVLFKDRMENMSKKIGYSDEEMVNSESIQ